jgi:hypothetical protein
MQFIYQAAKALETGAFGAVEINRILARIFVLSQFKKKAKQRVRPLLVCSFKC